VKFDLQKFYQFCSQLQIETKEKGLQRLDKLLGTQTYVMNEIARGLEEDIHFFTILKGRQLGVTTISLALDLYWVFTHPGLGATLVTDTEENREMFRSTLGMYFEHLPRQFKIPMEGHNRNQLVLKNRSRLFYQVAGLRAKGSLGRGKAITYLRAQRAASTCSMICMLRPKRLARRGPFFAAGGETSFTPQTQRRRYIKHIGMDD
jgi:hypothetical protein